MEKIICFYLEDCPYCKNAKNAIKELREENEEYLKIEIEWIEENEHPDIIDKYDYHAVPCMFYKEEKLYEAHLFEKYEETKNNIKEVFDKVLEDK